MGLFHTIWTVMKRGGTVMVSSGSSEIRWKPPLWRRVALALERDPYAVLTPAGARSLLGAVSHGPATPEQYSQGIRREWKPGLRGTRIVFELPYDHRRE